MAGKEISVKKYVVRLSVEEREQLETLIRKGKGPARRLLKARILLKADVSDASEGWSDDKIIVALDTSASMVYRVRKQLVEEGFEAVLSRKPRATPAVPRIFDGEKEAKLIALACSKPPQGYVRWTLRCQGDGPSYRHRLCAGAERLGRYSLPAQKIHRPGPGQPQYPQQGITLRGFPACRSQAVGRAVRMALHAQTRQLAQSGRIRAWRSLHPMPRPPHPRQAGPYRRDRRLGA